MCPPIGIMPRYIWLGFLETPTPSETEIKNRISELQEAIERYLEAGFTPLPKWQTEINHYSQK